MTAYLDTSLLVSLYTPDANSSEAAKHVSGDPGQLLLTSLGQIELINALELRRFRRELSGSETKAARLAFESDLAAGVFALFPVSAAVYDRARQLAAAHTARLGTRTLDILHVAGALVLGARAVYTFDRKLAALARAAGLTSPIRMS